MMIIDQNVGDFIVILSRIFKNKFEKIYWMIRFHPAILTSPIGRWWMMRKYMKIAEEIKTNLETDNNEKR
jgi:hypothetical protein